MEFITNPDFGKFADVCNAIHVKPRFALPFKPLDIAKAINSAYSAEVAARNCKMEGGEEYKAKVMSVAEWCADGYGRVGLLLFGTVGTGKTTMMNALCRVINYFVRPEYKELVLDEDYKKAIDTVRAKDVVDAYQNDRGLYDRMCKVKLLAIDEFGIEAIDVKSYGNSNEPIIDLLSMRYDRRLCTVISSNLDLNEIRNRYGLRLQDRFIEMFKMIAFTGKSYRK